MLTSPCSSRPPPANFIPQDATTLPATPASRLSPSLDIVAKSAGRHNNADVLRVLLAALVIVGHSSPLLTGKFGDTLLDKITNVQISLGPLCVQGFFLLSGYLIAMSWARRPVLGEFFKRRVERIVPGYTVCALICLCVAPIAAGGTVKGGYWRQIATQLATGDPPVHPALFATNPLTGVLNGCLWAIRYEAWMYLLVAVFGLLGIITAPGTPTHSRRILLLFLTSATLILSALQQRYFLFNGVYVPLLGGLDQWPRFLSAYLVGVTYFLWSEKVPMCGWCAAVATLLLAAVFVTGHPMGLVALVSPVLFGYLLLWATYARRIPLQRWGHWVRGDYSYGIYLYGFLVQQLIVATIGASELTPFSLSVLALVGVILPAVLSWHLVERRFLKRRPQTEIATREQYKGA